MAANEFPTTDWQLVRRGASAVDQIVQTYTPALRAHLISERWPNADALDDLLSGFVLSELIQRDLIGRADPAKGRFRNLIKTALIRYADGQYRRGNAKKRKPNGKVHPLGDHDPAGATPTTDKFDLEWARIILQKALDRMKADCEETDQQIVWNIFEHRLLRPILSNEPTDSYKLLKEKYDLRSPAQAANFLVTAKRKYQHHLRAVIGEYELNEAEIDEEIRDLIKIFSNNDA